MSSALLVGTDVGRAQPPRLTWDIAVDGDTWMIRLGGELDEQGGRMLTDLVAGELRAYSPRHVCLDLAEISFIDSSGLRGLLSALGAVQGHHSSYAIVRPSAVVCRLLDLNDLHEILRGS